MKSFAQNLTALVCLLLTLNLNAQIKDVNGANVYIDANRTAMSEIEKEMLKEINLVRTNPKGYVAIIKAYIAEQKAEWGSFENEQVAIELYSILENASPMNTLKSADCLFLAARNHGLNQAPTGDLNHMDTHNVDPATRIDNACGTQMYGKNTDNYGQENIAGLSWVKNRPYMPKDKASTARAANIDLLIDAGIQGHGHRQNILNPAWTHASAFQYWRDSDGAGNNWHYWLQYFSKEKK